MLPRARKAVHRLRARLRLSRLRARKLFRLAIEPRYWAGLRRGVAASVEHDRIPFRRDTKTVLDVGASRGQFALLASTRFPSAKIVCFEPLPGPFAELNDFLGEKVSAQNVAMGDRAGTASINVSASDDSSSLLPIGLRQVREFPGTDLERTIEVQVSTLDDEIKEPPARPCLLKLDVQGLELRVLMGATETLKSVDEALIECSFVELYEGQDLAEDVVAHMRDAGFYLAGVHEVTYSPDGAALQADFLFRRKAR